MILRRLATDQVWWVHGQVVVSEVHAGVLTGVRSINRKRKKNVFADEDSDEIEHLFVD